MWPINLINSALSLWGTAVYKIFGILQKNPSEFSESGWNTVVALCDSLKYIATALLVLFFGVSVLKQITNIQEMRRPETVFRLIFKFVIAKTMIIYSTDILMAIAKIGVGIVNCFMALIKQYLGHWVTLIAIIGGVILDILGIFVFTLVK